MDMDVVTLNLYAYVIGLGEASFSVETTSSIQIGQLKEEILPKIPKKPLGVVAAELTLYKVALKGSDDDLKTLTLESCQDKKKLDAREWISEIFLEQPSPKVVSIVIELPSIAVGHKRKRSSDGGTNYKIYPLHNDLMQLHKKLWGKGTDISNLPPDILREDADNHRYIALRNVFPSLDVTSRMLVRDEYIRIMKLIDDSEDAYKRVVIFGQPGIGKTLLLYLILLLCLLRGRATAFHIDKGGMYLLDADGVLWLPSWERPVLPNGTWYLFDSNASNIQPLDSITQLNNLHIIQSTSPKLNRWFDWSKQSVTGVEFVVMDLWSREEMRQLGLIRQYPDEKLNRFLQAFDKWGPSARHCTRFVEKENSFETFDIE